MSDALPLVVYSFECGDIVWHVRHITLEESLGRPYQGVLHLVTEQVDVIIDELIGADAVLEIARDDKLRRLTGCVDEIEHLGVVSHRAHVQVRIVPVLAWLGRTTRSRIFQDQTIPEIIEEVAGPLLAARGRTLDLTALGDRGVSPRDYCVQFHESDLAFLHRLLEEEGLTYRFDHAEATWETVLLAAATKDFPAFVGIDGSSELPLVQEGDVASIEERVLAFEWVRRVLAGRVHQRDWDWTTNPPAIHEATHENARTDSAAILPAPPAEVYHSGDHRPLALGALEPSLAARAERKQQALATADATGRGRTNATGLAPGCVLELSDEDFHGRYLVTHVIHQGDAPEADAVGGGAGAPSYENRFVCLPAEAMPRPARSTERPTIPGPQTAVVSGPPGEEIHTDEHGRIKVRMHWDRSGSPPEDASCWIRVAQPWAGPGWGSVFIPRVGMEVIVTFINGDPDRPICTGCVYNGGNRTPYPLPDEKTKSTLKSSSSPGGGGFNELTFEDAAGAEQIIIHAQKDFAETVLHDHTTSVGNDQSISVTANQSTAVSGNQTNTVTKDQTETVSGNVTVTVEGTRTQTVLGKETMTVDDDRGTTVTGTETLTVVKAVTETFQDTRTTTVTNADALTVTAGDKSVAVVSGSLTESAKTKIELLQGGAHQLLLEGGATLGTATDFTITNGKVSVSSMGGELMLVGTDAIKLVCGAASITLTSDGSIDIVGAKKVVMATPGSAVTAEPAGVTTNGAKLTAVAAGIHEIKGALVKIN